MRRRKKKSSGLDPGGDSSKVMDDYECEGRVLGVIDTVYKFQCKLFFVDMVMFPSYVKGLF